MSTRPTFRVVLTGDAGSGKTSILERYRHNIFNPGSCSTIGIDFATKQVNLDGKQVKLQIWDTSGQEKFHSITRSYYRGGHICLLVYDIGFQPSFDSLGKWFDEFREDCPNGIVMVVGSKLDQDRVVSREALQEFATQREAYYTEVSSKTGEGINPLFDLVTRKALEALQADTLIFRPDPSQLIHLDTKTGGKSYCQSCNN